MYQTRTHKYNLFILRIINKFPQVGTCVHSFLISTQNFSLFLFIIRITFHCSFCSQTPLTSDRPQVTSRIIHINKITTHSTCVTSLSFMTYRLLIPHSHSLFCINKGLLLFILFFNIPFPI